jgi:hypothetical protein
VVTNGEKLHDALCRYIYYWRSKINLSPCKYAAISEFRIYTGYRVYTDLYVYSLGEGKTLLYRKVKITSELFYQSFFIEGNVCLNLDSTNRYVLAVVPQSSVSYILPRPSSEEAG